MITLENFFFAISSRKSHRASARICRYFIDAHPAILTWTRLTFIYFRIAKLTGPTRCTIARKIETRSFITFSTVMTTLAISCENERKDRKSFLFNLSGGHTHTHQVIDLQTKIQFTCFTNGHICFTILACVARMACTCVTVIFIMTRCPILTWV